MPHQRHQHSSSSTTAWTGCTTHRLMTPPSSRMCTHPRLPPRAEHRRRSCRHCPATTPTERLQLVAHSHACSWPFTSTAQICAQDSNLEYISIAAERQGSLTCQQCSPSCSDVYVHGCSTHVQAARAYNLQLSCSEPVKSCCWSNVACADQHATVITTFFVLFLCCLSLCSSCCNNSQAISRLSGSHHTFRHPRVHGACAYMLKSWIADHLVHVGSPA